MPTMWIHRDISDVLSKNANFVEILTGPRQCGKSALLANLSPNFVELSMDDFALREAVSKDPLTILNQFEKKKLLIDEAQLAPEIFSALKRKVDLMKRASFSRETYFRLPASNQILMHKNVKESLAGRASYFELNTLSVAEINSAISIPTSEILFRGGWPELYRDDSIAIKRYLDDYLYAYVEKDIVLTAGIQKQNEFLKFIRLLAGRTGHLLNYSELAKEVGTSSEAIKDWVSILERMKFIALVEPYFSNYSKRLVKSPKVYFLDTGLAVRLQGHTSLAPLLVSPQFGHLFETLVFAEIYNTMKNFDKDWKIFHWRSRDGEEIDFILQLEDGTFMFIESKVTRHPLDSYDQYSEVKKVFKDNVPKCWMCHLDGDGAVGNNIPIKCLRDFLLNCTQN